MIKVYTGNIYRARAKIEKEIKGIDALNLARFDELTKEVFETASACPFFSDKRVVLVNIPMLTDCPEFLKYIENPVQQTDLYVFAGDIDKRTKTYKTLVSKGLVEECGKFSYSQLVSWVTGFLEKNGKKISAENVQYFIERTQYLVEDDVEFCIVEGYVRQLSFVSRGEIIKKDIDELVMETTSLKIFCLSDFLLEGKEKELFRYADRLLEQGEEPIAMLSLLERTFRIAYKATLFSEKPSVIGVPEQQYRKALKYKPEVLNGALDILQDGVHMLKSDIDRRVSFIYTISRVNDLLQQK